MKTLSLSEVKMKLSALVDEVLESDEEIGVVVVLVLAGSAGAAFIPEQRPQPLFPDDPWGDFDDECWWKPWGPGCQDDEPCLSCPEVGTCYTCISIPSGPDGEPGSYHCSTNTSGGHTLCSEDANGCSTSGSCGSWT